MVPLVIVGQTLVEILLILNTVADIGALFSSRHEEILAYEKLRLDAISRNKRAIGRNSLYQNTKQRSTVLPGTRCVLHVQSRKYDARKHSDIRSRDNSCKHVRNQSSN